MEDTNCEKCLEHMQTPPLCGLDEQQRKDCIEILKSPLSIDPENEAITKERKEFRKTYEAKTESELILEFKKRLRVSPYFFRVCLTNTSEDLKQQFNEIYGLTVDAHLEKHPCDILSLGDEPKAKIRAFFDEIFEISVFYDIIAKEASEEAKKDVLEMNQHKANVAQDIECLDLRTYYEHPGILKSQYELKWVNLKQLNSVKFAPNEQRGQNQRT